MIPRISVIIPTYNRAERCARLLRLLAEQTLPPGEFEVIAVDNASVDGTSQALEAIADELPYRLTILRIEDNKGPGPARNLGWRSASAPVVACTDDDCFPDPDWLRAGLAAIEADLSLGVVQGRTGPADINELYTSRWNHTVIVDGPGPYFETCNIFYRRRALEESGGFSEDYNWWGGWYGEDTVAGWRAIQAGWTRGFTPNAKMIHEVEPRGMKWWLRTSIMICNDVTLARTFDGYRLEAFWRSWSPRRDDAAFAVAVGSLATATVWAPAAIGVVPYLWWRRPSVRQPQFARNCVKTVLVDAARATGLIYGSLRERIVVV
jgi:glycosyltransferase involved in cell wall biosynthesis